MRGHSGAVSAQARLKLQGAMRRGSGIGRSIVRNFAMAALLVPLLGVLSAKAEAPAAHGGKFADPAFTALRDLSQSLGGKAFDGKAVARKVDLGDSFGSRFEVLSGVEPGDLVVIRGNERLRPGQPVAIRKRS